MSALHTNSIKWKDMLYSNSRYLVEKNGQFQFPFCSSSSKKIISSEMEAIANLCSVLSLGWRVGTDYKENVEANGWQNDITCSSFSVCIKMFKTLLPVLKIERKYLHVFNEWNNGPSEDCNH